MPKAQIDLSKTFASPDNIKGLRQELEAVVNAPPGYVAISEVIVELMPLIQGCRERGHTWEAIAKIFQRYSIEITAVALRKYAVELEPSLKGAMPKKAAPVAEITPIDSIPSPPNAAQTEPTVGLPKAQTRRKPTTKTRAQKTDSDKL